LKLTPSELAACVIPIAQLINAARTGKL